MFFLYFLIFILIGLFLNITRKYDLFTISIVYIVCSIFLYFIDIYAVIYVIMFFGIAEIITMILNKKHGKRDYKNVLGNCGASLVIFITGFILNKLLYVNLEMFIIASLATISAAFSDTLSSEIGLLSIKNPRMINTFKKVKKGTNGAISLIGIIGALLGSLITAIFFIIIEYNYLFIILISISGIIGSLIDSFTGAIIENKNQKINNNWNNFISTLITGIIIIIIYTIII
ncbi:MAG: DUF92 domain-containing protein [Candidatus ainarchaeum sp.]|nr:DUF92 domain-containing protein [Candidatus ainarchaeum sp.]MDD3976336.1 DUF92 domain-containing protein [Candidatus ainarchaeum sp.]